jgi:hypothetical protein
MFKKLPVALAALAAVVMTVAALAPATASAGSPEPAATATAPAGRTVVGGTGVLDAHGDGVVGLRGSVDLHASASGGLLLVRDFNHNAVVHVDGNGQTVQWLGFTVYFGFNGNATVLAPDAAVIVVGRDIDLHVVGRGWAFLKGRGEFTANGHGPFPWTPDGSFGSITP